MSAGLSLHQNSPNSAHMLHLVKNGPQYWAMSPKSESLHIHHKSQTFISARMWALSLGLSDKIAPQRPLEDFKRETPLPPCIYMHDSQHAYVLWHTLSPIGSLPFLFTDKILLPNDTIFLTCTLTNSSYRFNTTFSQYILRPWRWRNYQIILSLLSLVGVMVQLILLLHH